MSINAGVLNGTETIRGTSFGETLGKYRKKVSDFLGNTKKRIDDILQESVLGYQGVVRPTHWSKHHDRLLESQNVVQMYKDINEVISLYQEENIVLVSGLYLTKGTSEEVYIVDDVLKSIGTGLQPAGGKFGKNEGPLDALVREIEEELGYDVSTLDRGNLIYQDIHISSLPNGKKLAICRFALRSTQLKNTSFTFSSDVTSGAFIDNPFSLSYFPSMTPQTYWLFRKNGKESYLKPLFKFLFGDIDISQLPKEDMMRLCEIEYAFYKIYADTLSSGVKEIFGITQDNFKDIGNWDIPQMGDTQSLPIDAMLESMITQMQSVFDGLKIGNKSVKEGLGKLGIQEVFSQYLEARREHLVHLRNLKIISGK